METPVTFYRSGATRVPDLLGLFARPGTHDTYAVADDAVPVGVTLTELTQATWPVVLAAAAKGVELFVDSGAFSGPVMKTTWRRVLAGYQAIVRRAKNGNVTVVAPDVLRDQAATLHLLLRHRTALRRLAGLGARIVVPLPLGALSPSQAHDFVVATIFGHADFVAGVPTAERAGPYSVDDLVDLLLACPKAVHFLGCSPKSRGDRALAPKLDLVLALSPQTRVSCDANRFAAGIRKDARDRLAARLVEEGRAWSWDEDVARVWGDPYDEAFDLVRYGARMPSPDDVRRAAAGAGIAEQERLVARLSGQGLRDVLWEICVSGDPDAAEDAEVVRELCRVLADQAIGDIINKERPCLRRAITVKKLIREECHG